MAYLYLSMAIVMEVIATSLLKVTDGFTKLTPSLIVICGYAISFYFMSIVVKFIPIGISYAIWAGVGVIGTSLVGVVFYKQILDIPQIIGITLIILGIVVIHLFHHQPQ